MRQIAVLVEGQTEEAFVSQVLQPWLSEQGDYICRPIIVTTSRTPAGVKTRGGGRHWRLYADDLRKLLAGPHWHKVGLLLDYYAFPSDGPGAHERGASRDRHRRMTEALRAAHPDRRFVPCLALHEFETWVIAASSLTPGFISSAWDVAIEALTNECSGGFEVINDGRDTAPSKRLALIDEHYDKVRDGVLMVEAAGLDAVAEACPVLKEWLESLL